MSFSGIAGSRVESFSDSLLVLFGDFSNDAVALGLPIGEIGETTEGRNIGGSTVESLGNVGKSLLVLYISLDKVDGRVLDDRGVLLVALVANASFMLDCVDDTAFDGISGNVLMRLTGFFIVGDVAGNILPESGDIGACDSTIESFGN